jgi:hypothetical protein
VGVGVVVKATSRGLAVSGAKASSDQVKGSSERSALDRHSAYIPGGLSQRRTPVADTPSGAVGLGVLRGVSSGHRPPSACPQATNGSGPSAWRERGACVSRRDGTRGMIRGPDLRLCTVCGNSQSCPQVHSRHGYQTTIVGQHGCAWGGMPEEGSLARAAGVWHRVPYTSPGGRQQRPPMLCETPHRSSAPPCHRQGRTEQARGHRPRGAE